MKSRLIFDHVPKTAGTSISNALGQMFGESPGLPEFFNMHFQVIRGAGSRRVMAGHLWFTANEMLARNWYYATLLRDPVDRFLSQYWFYRALGLQARIDSNHAPHSDPQVRAATEVDLAAFLGSPDSRVQQSFINVQAIHFARRLTATPHVLSDKSLLEVAIAALEEYDLVGVFEDTQGFVDAIARDMALPRVALPRLNVTFERSRREDTPSRLVEKLIDANKVDIALYEWALRRFADKKRALSSTAETPAPQPTAVPAPSASPPPADGSDSQESDASSLDFGTYEAEIRSVTCAGEKSGEARISSGEPIRIHVEFVARTPLDDVTLGIAIRDKRGQLLYGTNTRYLGMALPVPTAGTFRATVLLSSPLGMGSYRVTLALHKGYSHEEGCYHWREGAATFTVANLGGKEFQGIVDLGLRLADDLESVPVGAGASPLVGAA